MLTELQKLELIKLALETFKQQRNISFNPTDFDLYIDKPSESTMCSIYIFSKRADDNFRIKLYVVDFNMFTTIGNYTFTQEQNFSTGSNDEIHIANCTMDKNMFKSFRSYLMSPQFTTDVVTATHRFIREDGSGFIQRENGTDLLVHEH